MRSETLERLREQFKAVAVRIVVDSKELPPMVSLDTALELLGEQAAEHLVR